VVEDCDFKVLDYNGAIYYGLPMVKDAGRIVRTMNNDIHSIYINKNGNFTYEACK
jgi:hypothetical protein